ncbi:MAG: beta-lactamase family protein [Gammaproteobacteria bacterium]|nr:beta-lactamase family protein [Gammaproteobacteria bacterium]
MFLSSSAALCFAGCGGTRSASARSSTRSGSAALCFAGCGGSSDSVDSELEANVNAVIDQAITDKRVVGAVVLVSRHGQVVYRRAAGLADREVGIAMRDDSIFRFASLTKPITSVAAMQMIEQGQLKLDDPVTKWLPYFKPALADGSTPEIKVRHLLNHTAGVGYAASELPNGPYHQLNVSDGLDQPGLSLRDNLTRLAAAPLLFAPGSRFQYGLSIDILGGVLEAVEGRRLREILRSRVTGPLGLSDIDFGVSDMSRLTKPYADGPTEPVAMDEPHALPRGQYALVFSPSRILNPNSYDAGGAGMAGTAPQFLKFLEMIRLGGAPVLKPATVEIMAADQTGTQAQAQGPGWGFGYGWAVAVEPALSESPQPAGTLQWGGGYGHKWFIDRKNELSVVILTNTARYGGGTFAELIRNSIYA